MRFAIITHTEHIKSENTFLAYSPYVREMNIWLKHVEEVVIVAPLADKPINAIHLAYNHFNINFHEINKFDVKSGKSIIKALVSFPKICIEIYKVMKKADHIHLRCPGNIGLIGCFIQILFPKKPKTVKYAGNWDFKSRQPLSYRLQQKILMNTFLTKNMQVLVYGEWPNMTKNIKPFFTATYNDSDKAPVLTRNFEEVIKFMFVGTLTPGKRPLYAIKLIQKLQMKGFDVSLDIFGDGVELKKLKEYTEDTNFQNIVFFKGNQTSEILKKAYQESHFLVLPSKSEGWPKVVAEAMFWGCVPLVSKISCVPNMLGDGKRGVLMEMDIEKDVGQVESLLKVQTDYFKKSKSAEDWSRKYTLDVFESEIKKMMYP